MLLEQSGKDATENFEDVGHSSDAREMMKKYKIGELVKEERSNVPEKSEPNWNEDHRKDEVSIKSWLLPLMLGIVATFVYKYFFGAKNHWNDWWLIDEIQIETNKQQQPSSEVTIKDTEALSLS